MKLLMQRKVCISAAIVFFLAALMYLFTDRQIAYFFEGMRGTDLRRFASFATDAGDALYPLIVIVSVWILFRRRKPEIAIKCFYLLWVMAVSGIVVNILKVVFGRLRPRYLIRDDLYGFEWFEFGYKYASFPSGHSSTAFGIGFALALMFPRYRFFHLLIWGFVAFTRVIVGAHYLSDVIVGCFIGAITAYYFYHNYLLKKVNNGLS